MALYVGTSGWAYPEWRGVFYPPGLPQNRFLEHYGASLSACEVNATFYRIQSGSVFQRWVESVPDGFRFAVKAHRRLTYRKQLALDAGTVAFAREFLDSLGPLGPKLAAVLIQVPEFVERDEGGLDRLLDLLPSGMAFTCELQHQSWQVREVEEMVAERGGTVCLRESEGAAPTALPPGPLGYVRLKAEHYTDEARDGLRALLASEASGRDVFAFARHKGVPPDDPHTGLGLARWLQAAEPSP